MNKYVQYGAGLCGPESWLNFDISPTLRLQRLPVIGRVFCGFGPQFPKTVRFGDIVSGLPLPPGCCEAMYCSHTLEHLALDDLRRALRNTYKYLKLGGRFRFVLPDLEQLAQDYLASQAWNAAHEFMNNSSLGTTSRPKGMSGIIRNAFGNSRHLWMWDYKAMHQELVDAGFQDIRKASYGDSGDAMFDAVEDPERWQRCLGVECWRS
jgi:predicted SAM-dependent methyltransferase